MQVEQPRKHSKQAGLLYLCLSIFFIPGKRRQRNQFTHSMVEFPTDHRRMDFKRTMAEYIERNSFPEPLCQLLRPFLEKWLVDFHAWMADIAQEDKICSSRNLQGKIRLAFARLKYLPFFGGTYSNRPGIHHHPRHLMLFQEAIEQKSVMLLVKIRMPHLHSQAKRSRPEIQKCFQLRQIIRSKCRRQLQKHRAKTRV